MKQLPPSDHRQHTRTLVNGQVLRNVRNHRRKQVGTHVRGLKLCSTSSSIFLNDRGQILERGGSFEILFDNSLSCA